MLEVVKKMKGLSFSYERQALLSDHSVPLKRSRGQSLTRKQNWISNPL